VTFRHADPLPLELISRMARAIVAERQGEAS
jgi:hypothetical protein